MNQVLLDILNTGYVTLAGGQKVKLNSGIDEKCGALLRQVIKKSRPELALEVGLAYGVSTLYILEALSDFGGKKLVGMDPAQYDEHWQGVGINNIEAAGYSSLYDFYEDTSQQVLPKLVCEGVRIDFAFIDGWHTFDHTLVDFFYIDQMLNTGGIVVFDDVWYPAIRRACEFVLANRDYEVFDVVHSPHEMPLPQKVKRRAKKILAPLCRTDKTPTQECQNKLSVLENVYFLALKKKSDDKRSFDHFVHF